MEILPGQIITYETRRESFDKVDKEKRYRQIEYILSRYTNGLTAKEIAVVMKKLNYTNNDDRNNAAPRLTELMYLGRVIPLDIKRICKYTGKSVTVYKLNEEPRQLNIFDEEVII